MGLNPLDLAVFGVYILASVGLGFYVSRTGRKTVKDYFLGDRDLPWYVIGTSIVATVVSTEHFIAQVGAAYSQGIVVAAFTWNAWIVYSMLVWIFLPYYIRSGVFTMPEFLERRYSPALRYLFAVFLALGYVASIIAGSLYAGGLALESIAGIDIRVGIFSLALITGAYTIYGGLKSAAWTDFLQMIVILVGGLLVPVLGILKAGGVFSLMQEFPDKFVLFRPSSDPVFPATGVFTGFLSIGLWYNCASQHIVQRCLGARDEWHSRMGVVFAGFLQMLVPFLFVLPGIIAWKLYPNLERPDHAYLTLVRELIPAGLRGLILAAMASALMSTLSSMVNSTSTLVTIDLYQRYWSPDASERRRVYVGQWSGAVTLALGVVIAFYYATLKDSFLFLLIQDVFAYIAPPFAVIFTAGILWRRANASGALATVSLGLPFGYLLQYWLLPGINYLHRAFMAWVFCVVLMVIVTLATKPPERSQVEGVIWNLRYARLPAELAGRYSGWRDFRIWWGVFVFCSVALYALLYWFGSNRNGV